MKIKPGLSNFIKCLEKRRFNLTKEDQRIKCEGNNLSHPVYLYNQTVGFGIETPLLKVSVQTEKITDYLHFMNFIYVPTKGMLDIFKLGDDLSEIPKKDSGCFKRTLKYGEVNINHRSIIFYPGFSSEGDSYTISLTVNDERVGGISTDLILLEVFNEAFSARDYFLHALYDISNSNPQLETLISRASKPRKLGSRIIL